MKLWDKNVAVNDMIIEFTSGKDSELDLQLAAHDVIGSLAHAKMLNSIGLLTSEELSLLSKELRKIYFAIEDGDFNIEPGVEDIHSQIELMLTRALDNTGKKIHTARSRNDQVLLDLKLFSREQIKKVVNQTEKLFSTIISLSNKYKDVLMPGYTHMQIAMPSSFGLWFGAYAESLTEDLVLMRAAYKIANQNPLGSAAGYGSSFPVDREMTTRDLGFDSMHVNVVNAQINRGKLEKIVSFALGSLCSTLAKMSMDICTYSGQNFGFLKLPDEYTTGSSIMPHKKNPDVFELIRAKCNKLQTLSWEISMISANLPSGYHRDFQIIKENYIPAFKEMIEILNITDMVVGSIEVNSEIVDDSLYTDLFSVEEVNKLVLEGLSFRDAYKEVASRIKKNKYMPDRKVKHTHIGSIGNPGNDLIEDKMKQVIKGFEFEKADKAIKALLKK